MASFFTLQNNATAAGRPKAYSNWMVLDEQQFKWVSEGNNSNVLQIPEITRAMGKQAMVASGTPIEIKQNGYLYVYLINESQGSVYFDDLNVQHIRGKLLQETHYYPFGLTMAGISSKSYGKLENKHKFKGKELQSRELSDGSGLEMYDFGARMYDNQVARWHVVDPLSDKYINTSPYAFVNNNPISNIEIDGRHFDEVNERKAQKIEQRIDKRIGKPEKQIAKLEKKGKDIGDRNDRIGELRNSKKDIKDMRDDKTHEYRYAGVKGNEGPYTTAEGESGDVIVMHTTNGMGSKLHETRHGGQAARGEFNFTKNGDGTWSPGNLYGVNDEVSAYRAQ